MVTGCCCCLHEAPLEPIQQSLFYDESLGTAGYGNNHLWINKLPFIAHKLAHLDDTAVRLYDGILQYRIDLQRLYIGIGELIKDTTNVSLYNGRHQYLI